MTANGGVAAENEKVLISMMLSADDGDCED
ncbi:hypothetical protein A2U01_0024256, partial [Trifolium medium]|nr:hypothetical protein [Trifolium medium]